jgi:CBS domain-containing protein
MGFREQLEQEPTSSLPLRDAVVVHSGTLVRAAVAEMRTHSLGCAVIVDSAGVPSGIFTEQSVIELLVQNASLDDRPIQDFADPSFVSVRSSEPISRVWDAIQLAGARFVCVTDDDGRLIGITGHRGVAEYLADCFAEQVTVQRLGSTPWMQNREGA